MVEERIALDTPLAGHSGVELDLSPRVTGHQIACFSVSIRRQKERNKIRNKFPQILQHMTIL